MILAYAVCHTGGRSALCVCGFPFFSFSLFPFFPSSHFPRVAFREEAENIEQTADVPKIQMCEKDS